MNKAGSVNLGRLFAGQSIADSIGFNEKLSESVNFELMRQLNEENNLKASDSHVDSSEIDVHKSLASAADGNRSGVDLL